MSNATENPSISVIISGNLLPQTLESVLEQTFRNWELLFVGPSSVEPSSLAQKDARIRVLSQNAKLSLEEVKREAKGEYIAFLENGDLYCPDFLEKLYSHSQFLEQMDVALINFHSLDKQLCYSDAWSWTQLRKKNLDPKKHQVRYIKFGETRSCIRHRLKNEAWSKPIAFYLLHGLSPIRGRKFYRREFLDQLSESEDLPFHWMSCIQASHLLFCDAVGYRHNMQQSSEISGLQQLGHLLDSLADSLAVHDHFYLLLWMRSLVATFCFGLRRPPKRSKDQLSSGAEAGAETGAKTGSETGFQAWQSFFRACQLLLSQKIAENETLRKVLKPTYRLKFSDFRHLHLSLLEIMAWNLLLSRATKKRFQASGECDKLTLCFLALLYCPVTHYWRAARERWLATKL